MLYLTAKSLAKSLYSVFCFSYLYLDIIMSTNLTVTASISFAAWQYWEKNIEHKRLKNLEYQRWGECVPAGVVIPSF